MMNVECIFCGGRYCVIANDIDSLLYMDIKYGAEFPSQCPFCGPASYAVLADEDNN
jgi:hypothetical protein